MRTATHHRVRTVRLIITWGGNPGRDMAGSRARTRKEAPSPSLAREVEEEGNTTTTIITIAYRVNDTPDQLKGSRRRAIAVTNCRGRLHTVVAMKALLHKGE